MAERSKALFGYDYKLLFRRENARSEKIPPNALRYGRLSTSRLQLAGRVCTENQESEIAATISILCIAARPSRGFLVSEDKQALKQRARRLIMCSTVNYVRPCECLSRISCRSSLVSRDLGFTSGASGLAFSSPQQTVIS